MSRRRLYYQQSFSGRKSESDFLLDPNLEFRINFLTKPNVGNKSNFHVFFIIISPCCLKRTENLIAVTLNIFLCMMGMASEKRPMHAAKTP